MHWEIAGSMSCAVNGWFCLSTLWMYWDFWMALRIDHVNAYWQCEFTLSICIYMADMLNHIFRQCSHGTQDHIWLHISHKWSCVLCEDCLNIFNFPCSGCLLEPAVYNCTEEYLYHIQLVETACQTWTESDPVWRHGQAQCQVGQSNTKVGPTFDNFRPGLIDFWNEKSGT